MKRERRANSRYKTTTTGGVTFKNRVSVVVVIYLICLLLLSQIALVQSQNITTNESSLSELKGLDHAVYNDGTILLRLIAPDGTNCNGGLNLRLIYPNGTIETVSNNNDYQTIPPDNYCLNGTNFTVNATLDNTLGGSDAIRIYAIPDYYILVTYYQNIQNKNVSGLILNWNGEVLSYPNFGNTCDNSEIVPNHNTVDGGFLRVCYVENQPITWTKWSFPSADGSISAILNGTLNVPDGIYAFSSNFTKIFATEKGNYCMITSTYTSSSSTWKLFASFVTFTNDTSSPYSVVGPLQIYEVSANDTSLSIYSCGIAYATVGYSCLLYNSQEFSVINFFSSGSVLAVNEIQNVTMPDYILTGFSLFYGGTLMVVQNSDGSTEGWVLDNTSVRTSASLQSSNNNYLRVGAFLNNSVWTVGANANEWTISTFSNFSNFGTANVGQNNASGGPGPYGSLYVSSCNPANGSSFTPTNIFKLNITYQEVINLSTGNISIWQSNSSTYSYDIFGGKYDILRQTTSASNSKYVSLADDNKTVTVNVLQSTFDQPNTDYYVVIDNGFVTDAMYNQPLIGVRRNVWLITSDSSLFDQSTDPKSCNVRLNVAGSSQYVSLSKSDKDQFVQKLGSQLASTIPCIQSRIYVRSNYQYDFTLHERKKILFRVDVFSNEDVGGNSTVSSYSIVHYMNASIVNKNITGISKNSLTNFLDHTYGAHIAPGLWERYRWILLGSFIGLLVLFIIYALARKKSRDGLNISIFLFVFIMVDFALDVSFVVLHGKDLTWTYPTSLVLLIVPLVINTLAAFFLISYEQSKNRFLEWWIMHSKTGFILLVFSLIDLDCWTIMSSEFAGMKNFSAPLTVKTRKTIFYLNIVNLIIEDVGQAVVLILYQVYTVLPQIIPILVLSSCIFVIMIKIMTFIYASTCRRPGVFGNEFDDGLIDSRLHKTIGDSDDPLEDISGSPYTSFLGFKKKKKKSRHHKTTSSSSGSDFYTPGEYKGIAAEFNDNGNNGEKGDIPELSENFVVNTSTGGGPIFSLKKVDAPVHSISHGKKVEDAITNVVEEGYTPSEKDSGLLGVYGSGKVYGSEVSIPKRSSDFGIIGHTGHTGRLFEGEEVVIEDGASGLSVEQSATASQVQQTSTGETPIRTTTDENIDDRGTGREIETEKERRGGPQLTRIGSVDTSVSGTDTTISRTSTTFSRTTMESDEAGRGSVRRTSSGDVSSRIKREISNEMMGDISESEEGSRL